ncbi:MAG: hypothetical protein ABIH99_01915 [Candidatus Micrarchaeota archaeon]
MERVEFGESDLKLLFEYSAMKMRGFVLVSSILLILLFSLAGCITLELNKPNPKLEINACTLTNNGSTFYAEEEIYLKNEGGSGTLEVRGAFIGSEGSARRENKTIELESGEERVVRLVFPADVHDTGVCSAEAEVILSEQNVERMVGLKTIASAENVHSKNEFVCPSSCDDGKPCTSDYCGKETDYKCKNSALNGEQPGCSEAVGACGKSACSLGVCVVSNVSNCCGNGKCEGSENVGSCALDCKSKLDVSCEVLDELIPAHAIVASSLNVSEAKCTIINNDDRSANIVLTSEIAGWSDEFKKTLSIAPGEEREVDQTFTFKDKFFSNNELAPATANFKIEQEGRVVFEQSKELDIGAKGDIIWSSEEQWDLAPTIAVWVTPHDPCVEQVISLAKEKKEDRAMGGYVGYSSMYVSGRESETYAQAEAAYKAIQDLGVSYVNSYISFTPGESQRVRLPWESVEQKSGNCIDGSVLFASVFENLGMNARIILVPGHAFVGVESYDGSNKYLYIETTLLGTNSFEDAVDSAASTFNEYKNTDEIMAIDISDYRELGITPFPSAGRTTCSYSLLKCTDGTNSGSCSANKPNYCQGGKLVEKASACGCPAGYYENGDECLEAETLIFDQTYSVEGGYVRYYGGDATSASSNVQFHYLVTSSAPIDIYVVPSKTDYYSFLNGDEFNHYPTCRAFSSLNYDQLCTVNTRGGIVMANNGESAVTMHLTVYVVNS